MNRPFILFVLLIASGAANADIPVVSATCPGHIEVRVDEGDVVYINGKESALKKFSETYFEASGSGVTVSLMITADGAVDVSYTGSHRAHGVCSVVVD